MYNILDVCKYILIYYKNRESSLSNLKLQKVLYFLQAEFLVAKNEPCFSSPIMAWDVGPVVPRAYNEYKVFGGAMIPNYFLEDDVSYTFHKEDREIMDGILDATFRHSATTLTKFSMNQSPWKLSYIPHFPREIPHSLIKIFFEE